MSKLYYLTLLALVIVIGGCATGSKEIYYWGAYEDIIYNIYHKPDEATAEAQVEKLTVDIERAQAAGKNVPPGLYAHLGVMQLSLGNVADATASFEEEKRAFPESGVLIDGMMQRFRRAYQ